MALGCLRRGRGRRCRPGEPGVEAVADVGDVRSEVVELLGEAGGELEGRQVFLHCQQFLAAGLDVGLSGGGAELLFDLADALVAVVDAALDAPSGTAAASAG